MTNHTTQRDATTRLVARPSLELHLIDGNRHVGWISGHGVGFRGFADATEAVHAAWVAHRALACRLGASPARGEHTFALARHDDRESILVDGESIAALVRPGSDSRSGPDSFGFEIRIPERADEIFPRAMAYRMYLALRKSGVAWELWRTTPLQNAGASQDRTTIPDRAAASTDETTTINEGGDRNVIDEIRQRARRYLPPRWGRGRRTSAREHAEHRVRRIRERR
jgi:hypothetical protein